MINAALEYLNQGYCVIPIKRNKKPHLMAWAPYQEKMPTIEAVKTWWREWPDANIGIVTGKISNLCVIDVDSNAGGAEIKKLLPGILPTVTTPGGGWHFYFANTNGLGNAAGVIQDVDFRGQGGYIIAPPSIGENGKAYEFYKDSDINRDNILPTIIKEMLSSLSRSYCKDSANGDVHPCPPMSTIVHLMEKGTRDEHLFHLANCLVKGRMQEENIRKYLHFFASNCNPPFTPKETELKIKSALKRAEKREINISGEIRSFVLSTSGHFLSTEVQNCLLLSTRKEKKLCSKVLSEMVSEGTIERYGNKNGMFRKIEDEAPDINIFNTQVEFMDLKFPLDLHSWFRAMPKNIAVVAGTQDAGKTAMLLRFTSLNMNRGMDIRYMTSEMGGMELKDRLEDFEDIPIEDWSKVNFKEVSSNFQDYILPNGINVIDYLEVTDNFYLVGSELKKIYDKLSGGFAFIGLQKDFKSDLGRGGTFSLEKPRLYISLTSNPPEGGIAKIVKCKNWVHKRLNPNGRVLNFVIRNGNEIRGIGNWEYPSEKQK